MKNILPSDHLKSSSEEEVCEILIDWGKGYKKNGKKESFCELLKQIRYTHLSKPVI